MALRFAPNLSMLYTEVPFLERFAKAAAAGFRHVEFLFAYEVGAEAIRQRLDDLGLTVVLFNLYPGDFAAGERGLLSHPDRRDEARRRVEEALEFARRIGCHRIHAMLGNRRPDLERARQVACAVEQLAWAAPLAEEADVTLLVEPLNAFDAPDYLIHTTAEGMEIVRAVDHPRVRLQYDVYHGQMQEGNLIHTITEHLAHIGHIQISDVPGRHQPGTGEIHFPNIFAALEQLGYTGYIGLEYRPLGETDESLAWLPQKARG